MSTYRICGDSQIGRSHENDGTLCQDSHHFIECAGFAVAAVADGLGSSKHSDIASKIAAYDAVDYCADCIDSGMSEQEILACIRQAFDKVNFTIKQRADGALDDYDTTLTLAVFAAGDVYYGHAGDSGIIALRKDGIFAEVTVPQLGSGQGKERPVYPLAAEAQWVFGKYEHHARALFLMTDGMLNKAIPPLLENQEYKLDHAYLYYLYDNMRKNINIDIWVKNELASIHPGEINYDDKTLVALTCNSVRFTPQPKRYYEFPSMELWDTLKEQHNEGLYPYKMMDRVFYDSPVPPAETPLPETPPTEILPQETRLPEMLPQEKLQTDTAQEGFIQHEAAQPQMQQPGVSQPGSELFELSQQEAAPPEAAQPETAQPQYAAGPAYIGAAGSGFSRSDGQGYAGGYNRQYTKKSSRSNTRWLPLALIFVAAFILGAVVMSAIFLVLFNPNDDAGKDGIQAGPSSSANGAQMQPSADNPSDGHVSGSQPGDTPGGSDLTPPSAGPSTTLSPPPSPSPSLSPSPLPTDTPPPPPPADLMITIKGGEYPADSAVLDLSDMDITDSDLIELSQMTGLTELNLSGNRIGDIGVLAGLKELALLDLSNNNIDDIGVLAGLSELAVLNLSGNQISDIDALAGMKNLRELDLTGNLISELGALAGMTVMEELILSGNPLDEDDIDVLRSQLPQCNIHFVV